MSVLRARGLALVAALCCAAAQAAPEGATLALDNPFRARGDAAKALELLLAEVARDPEAPGLTLLLSEVERVREFVPGALAPTRARLEQVLQGLGPHPNRDDLAQEVVRLRLESGDRAGALALQGERGFLTTWATVGFFGFTPGAFEEAWPPELAAQEEALDLAARFPTRRDALGWRDLEFSNPDSIVVDLGEALSGSGVAYAVTHVKLAAAAEGQLVYSGPSFKAWVNLHPLAEVDRVRDRTDSELRVRVPLQAGWNRILLKLVGNTSTRFTLRLTDPAGTPLAVEEVARDARVGAHPSPAAEVHGSWALEALGELADPEARLLYACSLSQRGRGEEGLLAFDQALAAHPALGERAWVRLLEAELAERGDHLPQSLRRQRAQRALERALELDPEHVEAQRRRAELSFRDDRELDGIQRLEAILSAVPGDHATRLRLVNALLQKGWVLPAERALSELEQLAPSLPGVLEARARIFRARDDELGEQASRELLYLEDRSRISSVLARFDLALARGDLPAAREVLAALGELGVSDDARQRLEERLARAGGDDEARLAVLRERASARPWDEARQRALIEALIELGGEAREREAVERLDALLAEAPGRHELRALREALRGEDGRFWEAWEPDLEQVLADAPDASHWPRAATVCLFDQTVTRVYPDGSAEDAVHQIWRVLTQEGVERYGSRPQAGRLLTIRTRTPDGAILEPIRAGNTFEMPGLAPGAVVEHAYRSESGPARLQYSNGPFYFQDPDLTEPFWLSRWVIWIHEDAPVEVVQKNMGRKGILVRREQRGPWTIHEFTARDQPRREQEPLAPHRDEVLPWVKLVEKVGLEELGEFNRTRAILAQQVTPSVARAAEAATAGLDAPLARAQALFRFVHERVTRQGNETRPAEILAAGEGSKTSLYLALLRAADVPHRFAMAARPRDVGGRPVNWALPELGVFQTPLIRLDLEGGPRWVFAEGAPGSPFAALPPEVWGATAYVCQHGGGTLDVVPAGSPQERTQESEVALSLGLDASRFELRKVLPDYGLYGLKERFAGVPEDRLRRVFVGQVNELYPAARLLSGAFEDLEAPGVPLTVRVEGEGQLVTVQQGQTLLKPPFSPAQLGRSLGAFPRRAMDLVLDGLSLHDRATVELGPYRCPRVPEPVLLVTPHGQFSLLYRQEAGRVTVERSLELFRGRVEAKDYPAFREFLQQIDEAESRALLLAPGS
ncbi:MAG: hypothetical protein R3F62_27555 [Planctomycetota bacterium]